MQQLTVSLAELPATVRPDSTMALLLCAPGGSVGSSIPSGTAGDSQPESLYISSSSSCCCCTARAPHFPTTAPWQKFHCLFLFVCCWCCFPDGRSSAGGVILLVFNGFKLSLLLKPACPAAEGAVQGSVTRLWPWNQQCRGAGGAGGLLGQVLLPDRLRCWSRKE